MDGWNNGPKIWQWPCFPGLPTFNTRKRLFRAVCEIFRIAFHQCEIFRAPCEIFRIDFRRGFSKWPQSRPIGQRERPRGAIGSPLPPGCNWLSLLPLLARILKVKNFFTFVPLYKLSAAISFTYYVLRINYRISRITISEIHFSNFLILKPF